MTNGGADSLQYGECLVGNVFLLFKDSGPFLYSLFYLFKYREGIS